MKKIKYIVRFFFVLLIIFSIFNDFLLSEKENTDCNPIGFQGIVYIKNTGEYECCK